METGTKVEKGRSSTQSGNLTRGGFREGTEEALSPGAETLGSAKISNKIVIFEILLTKCRAQLIN